MNSLMPVAANKSTMNMVFSSNSSSASTGTEWHMPVLWFSVFLLVFLVLFAYYYDQFSDSSQNWMDSITMWYTGKGSPSAPISSAPPPVVRPVSVQEDQTNKPSGMEAVVEKVLPPAKEIFTVSKNNYTYYDAAPLCKALGAELATYDEVKRAFQKGGDWCNYGWVKGQMAVYPTQKSTYEELQQGPPEQRGACGKPGVNGGYFDNPELKFGVTCAGKKPSQSDHDATTVASGATRPLTASGLEFEKKVQRFQAEADEIGVLPFNKGKWTS
jgi:hypothetical protein